MNLEEKADEIRKQVVAIAIKNNAGHIASSLSCIDILTVLYYGLMNLGDSLFCEDRDHLIFSKAHGCYGLYAILVDKGYIPKKEWENFYNVEHLLVCERNLELGIEAGCGSLGHGLPMAVGIAFGTKLQKKPYRTYCIVGDGEMQEGSCWEAIQFAVKQKLSNLTIIIDHNKLQAMDFLENIMTIEGRKIDLQRKLKAFGLIVKTCNGHNPKEILAIIKKWIKNQAKFDYPQVLVANTIKGYGLLCMENVPKFHFRVPTEDELKIGRRYDE